jgi:electron transfer flavoprotein beta subunit
LEKNTITVRREVEGGSEIIESPLPTLLTVELQLATPRYAPLPELVRALRQDIKIWGAKDIDSLPEQLGLKGSPTWVKQIFTPPPRGGGVIFDSVEKKEQAIEDFLNVFFEKEQKLVKEILSGGEG